MISGAAFASYTSLRQTKRSATVAAFGPAGGAGSVIVARRHEPSHGPRLDPVGHAVFPDEVSRCDSATGEKTFQLVLGDGPLACVAIAKEPFRVHGIPQRGKNEAGSVSTYFAGTGR